MIFYIEESWKNLIQIIKFDNFRKIHKMITEIYSNNILIKGMGKLNLQKRLKQVSNKKN